MSIDNLTIGEAKQLASLFSNNNSGLNGMIGQQVIIRTYSAGVWFGTLTEKAGNEVIISEARRLWQWKAERGITLSECATYGINRSKSRIPAPISKVWLEAIEILPCTEVAAESIAGADHDQAR